MPVEMTVKGLMLDPNTHGPIVILKDAASERALPIWINMAEASAIASQMENIPTARPMTHDLLRNVITNLDGQVERVVVSDIRESVFYARIHLLVRGEPVVIDARPSDAIALALRTRAPILVEEHVLESAEGSDTGTEPSEDERLQKWLEGLDPDALGKYKM
ncbi:MAG: bifunctional nuclease family protein [Acidobacteria bacterium]|nr:bifunctional nuclease family protein [Acidobacteriota bacterium]